MSSEIDVCLIDDGVVEVQIEDIESVTYAILEGLSTVDESSEAASHPLYEQFEPDALSDLLHHSRRFDSHVRVTFTIENYTIAVNSDGLVRICRNERQPNSVVSGP